MKIYKYIMLILSMFVFYNLIHAHMWYTLLALMIYIILLGEYLVGDAYKD